MLIKILFIFAFILNIIAAIYAFYIRKTMKGGSLQRVALATALSALVFGVHHLGEIASAEQGLMAIAESIESISALLLIWAIYELYQITKI